MKWWLQQFVCLKKENKGFDSFRFCLMEWALELGTTFNNWHKWRKTLEASLVHFTIQHWQATALWGGGIAKSRACWWVLFPSSRAGEYCSIWQSWMERTCVQKWLLASLKSRWCQKILSCFSRQNHFLYSYDKGLKLRALCWRYYIERDRQTSLKHQKPSKK